MICSSAGSAAIHYAIQTLTRAGDNIVTTPQLYGGTYTLFAHLLPSFGVDVRFACNDSAEAIAEALKHSNQRPNLHELAIHGDFKR